MSSFGGWGVNEFHLVFTKNTATSSKASDIAASHAIHRNDHSAVAKIDRMKSHHRAWDHSPKNNHDGTARKNNIAKSTLVNSLLFVLANLNWLTAWVTDHSSETAPIIATSFKLMSMFQSNTIKSFLPLTEQGVGWSSYTILHRQIKQILLFSLQYHSTKQEKYLLLEALYMFSHLTKPH